MFKGSPASLQTFIDTPNCVIEDRVQYITVRIPNVFCDGNPQIINVFTCLLYCNHQVQRDFLIILNIYSCFTSTPSILSTPIISNVNHKVNDVH
jgi:hypothetical protein